MFKKMRVGKPILLLTAGHAAVDLYINILAAVAPGLAIYLGLNLGDVVILVGLASLVCNLVQPFLGYVMNRRNLSWILWFAVFLSILPAGMGFAGGYWSLAALALLGALGTGLFHPEGALAANDASGDKAYLGVPVFMAGGSIGYAAGTLASIRISEFYGYPALAILALPGALTGIFMMLEHRERRRTHPSVVIKPRSKRITHHDAHHLPFWPLFAEGVLFLLANGVFLGVMTSHYEECFGSGARTMAGWILLVMGINGAIFPLIWSALAKRKGFYPVALVTQALSFPLFALMAFPATPVLGLEVAIPLSMVAPTAVYPVTIALARNAAGMTQSTRTALIMGGAGLISSLGVVAAGALLRAGLPSSRLILVVAGCSLAAIGIAVWQLVRQRSLRLRGFQQVI
ncbi:MAG: MFS transporter [Planctomycetota bacterium]|jgi:FSR family fosmidomycin resistance protein-like MFS transporter|nr:MFS transporter [Planctomycetota bacterium]